MTTNGEAIEPDTLKHIANPDKQSPTEIIREIFASVLGRRNFSDDDEFFDLGGTSLGLIAVVARVCGRLGINVEADIASEGASVSALACAVSGVLTNPDCGRNQYASP